MRVPEMEQMRDRICFRRISALDREDFKFEIKQNKEGDEE